MTIRSFVAATCATVATSIAVPVVAHDGQAETVDREKLESDNYLDKVEGAQLNFEFRK